MFWRKDGKKLHEEGKYMEIFPNHDGTFQRSVDLKLSSVSPEEWSRYECVFQLPGVVDDIVTVLDTSVIRTNWGKMGPKWVLILISFLECLLFESQMCFSPSCTVSYWGGRWRCRSGPPAPPRPHYCFFHLEKT